MASRKYRFTHVANIFLKDSASPHERGEIADMKHLHFSFVKSFGAKFLEASHMPIQVLF